jgi:hypothetical protein
MAANQSQEAIRDTPRFAYDGLNWISCRAGVGECPGASARGLKMKDTARIFLELLENDVTHPSEVLAKRMRSVLPKDMLNSMTPDQFGEFIATMREGMEFAISSFLAHFDNVGSHLPEEVLGFKILTHITDTDEQQDIREGEADYVDMWQNYMLDTRW